MNPLKRSSRYPGARRVGLPLLAVAAVLISAGAFAAAPTMPEALDLPSGSTQAVLGKNMRLFGMPVDIRLIEIPLPVDRAVAALTARYPALSDLGIYPGWVVLSGQAETNLWLVTLEAASPRRTRGTVTSLDPASARHARGALPPDWLPSPAQLRMDFSELDANLRTRQQIWTLPMPLAQARKSTEQGLLRHGWRVLAADIDTGQWHRGGTTLGVTYAAIDGGSGLLLQLHEKSTP